MTAEPSGFCKVLGSREKLGFSDLSSAVVISKSSENRSSFASVSLTEGHNRDGRHLLTDELSSNNLFPCFCILFVATASTFVCTASPHTFQFLHMSESMLSWLSQSELCISLSHDPGGTMGGGCLQAYWNRGRDSLLTLNLEAVRAELWWPPCHHEQLSQWSPWVNLGGGGGGRDWVWQLSLNPG